MIEAMIVFVSFLLFVALACLDWQNLFAKPRQEWPCDFTGRKESCCPTFKCEPLNEEDKKRNLPIAWQNYWDKQR